MTRRQHQEEEPRLGGPTPTSLSVIVWGWILLVVSGTPPLLGGDSPGLPRLLRLLEEGPPVARRVDPGGLGEQPRDSTTLPLPSPKARMTVDSHSISFGEVIPGEERILPGAVMIRVRSPGDWILKLVPKGPLAASDRGEIVPLSRLSWKGNFSPQFVPFREEQAAEVAWGLGTMGILGTDQLVYVDLRLALEETDPVGQYFCQFQVILESR